MGKDEAVGGGGGREHTTNNKNPTQDVGNIITSPFLMDKSTINKWAIFYSKLSVYQRIKPGWLVDVCGYHCH